MTSVRRPSIVQEQFPLASLTTIGTGGPARFFARPSDEEELHDCLAWAVDEGVAVRVVGLGSNLLPADSGYDGLVLRLDGGLARSRSNRRWCAAAAARRWPRSSG